MIMVMRKRGRSAGCWHNTITDKRSSDRERGGDNYFEQWTYDGQLYFIHVFNIKSFSYDYIL